MGEKGAESLTLRKTGRSTTGALPEATFPRLRRRTSLETTQRKTGQASILTGAHFDHVGAGGQRNADFFCARAPRREHRSLSPAPRHRSPTWNDPTERTRA